MLKRCVGRLCKCPISSANSFVKGFILSAERHNLTSGRQFDCTRKGFDPNGRVECLDHYAKNGTSYALFFQRHYSILYILPSIMIAGINSLPRVDWRDQPPCPARASLVKKITLTNHRYLTILQQSTISEFGALKYFTQNTLLICSFLWQFTSKDNRSLYNPIINFWQECGLPNSYFRTTMV